MGPCGGWGRCGSRCFLSFLADFESRLAEPLFGQRPLCLSVLFFRPALLPPNSARRSRPSGFASTFCLQPLLPDSCLQAAPGLQVGTFTGGSSLEAGLFLWALLVSERLGGPGRVQEGRRREPTNLGCREKATPGSGALDCLGKAPIFSLFLPSEQAFKKSCLCWGFVAAYGFSLVSMSRGYS